MTAEELRALLQAAQGEAVQTFITVLHDPAAALNLEGAGTPGTETASLLSIYRRRTEHVERVAVPVLGMRETVERLAATTHEFLAVVVAEGPGGYPVCVAFLSSDLSEVAVAVAVTGPAARV